MLCAGAPDDTLMPLRWISLRQSTDWQNIFLFLVPFHHSRWTRYSILFPFVWLEFVAYIVAGIPLQNYITKGFSWGIFTIFIRNVVLNPVSFRCLKTSVSFDTLAHEFILAENMFQFLQWTLRLHFDVYMRRTKGLFRNGKFVRLLVEWIMDNWIDGTSQAIWVSLMVALWE